MRKIFYAIFISCFFISCGGNKSKGNYFVEESSDSLQYIKIADATDFLPSWKKENTLVYQVLAEPDNLHPTNGKTIMRNEVMMYTQMFLLNVDFYNNTMRPSLLKELPVVAADGLLYACELRNDIVWDNGDTLNADDIIFTLKAYKCPLTHNEFFKPYLENFQDIIVDAANPKKFTVKVKQPYIQNTAIWSDIVIMQRKFHDAKNVLANYSVAQMNDTAFANKASSEIKKWVDDFNGDDKGFDIAKLNGLGMYKVSEWEQGQYLVLKKKQNHHSQNSTTPFETSYPEKIIFKVNKDANSNVLEFKKQNFDASVTLATKALVSLQQDSDFNLNYNSRFVNTYNYSYAAFNMKPDGVKHKNLFTDANVRKAVAMLVPYEQINKVVYLGNYKRQAGPVCKYKKGFNTDVHPVEYNFNDAVKLLNDAGWKDSDNDGVIDKMIDGRKTNFEFALNVYANIPDWQDFALLIQGEMKKAGIIMSINSLEVQVFLQNARSHDFDMLLGVWSTSVTPEDYSQIWHTQSWASNGDNYGGFGNAESDALIDSIKSTLDDAKRNEMDKRFQKMVADMQPYIFLFNSQRRIAVHKRFGNCELFFEKPGVMLNNLKILSGTAVKAEVNP